MRRRSLTGQPTHFESINVTPLIDVVMCMIIFFLIVGKLAGDRGAFVRVPEAASGAEETAAAVLVVTIAGQGTPQPGARGWAAFGVTVEIDGQETPDAEGLTAAIRTALLEKPLTSVQVRADRDLSFGSVEPVLRACGVAGARSVRLATERPL